MSPKRSWLDIPPDSHFSLENIPFGIITTASNPSPRVATAIGSYAFDLFSFFFINDYAGLEITGDMDAATTRAHFDIFSSSTLNRLASFGKPVTAAVRRHVQTLFDSDTPYGALLRDNERVKRKVLIPLTGVKMHMPFDIKDYTDFYVGLNHAVNCGRLMRGPGQELQPNYKHLPVGYHGRASSVVVSGTPITRPSGQILPVPGASAPIFSACRKLDFELELGCFIGKGNDMGSPIRIQDAQDHIFGVVLLNDWSARDIQTWEMVPLGPFNAKNFGTSISPWVVTMDALEPFLVKGLESERALLDYLKDEKEGRVVDIKLEVDLQSELFV
jgi:fumarylacetoacetase